MFYDRDSAAHYLAVPGRESKGEIIFSVAADLKKGNLDHLQGEWAIDLLDENGNRR